MNNTIDFNAGTLVGFMTLTATDSVTGKVRTIGPYPNLVTNYGVDLMFTNSQTFAAVSTYCGVGTGSTAPAATDTTLVTQVGTRTNASTLISDTNSGTPNYIHSYIRNFAFSTGQVVGNLTETGFFSASTGSTCSARALIKDGSGNPTSFPVLVTEALTVTYENRFIPNTTDVTSSVVISGVTYTTVTRPAGAGAASSVINSTFALPSSLIRAYEANTLGAITATPAGTPQAGSSGSLATYTNGNYYRDVTVVFDPTTGNFATGMGSILPLGFTTFVGFQISFTPKIPKLNTQTLTLPFRVSIGRP